MIVVIDGYNLIKQIVGVSRVSHAQRDQFINDIARYLHKQKLEGVLVFDGGDFSYPYTIKHDKITIIFSGHKEKADQVIMDFIDKHPEHELLIVSSDREIRNHAQTKNKTSIPADEFYYRFVQKKPEPKAHTATALHKTAVDSPPELDQLMHDATKNMFKKEEKENTETEKNRTSPAQRTSKKERVLNRVIRKL